MAVYLKVTAEVTIKIQDPLDENTIEEAKENLVITSPDEIVDEQYTYTIVDAD